MRDSKREQSRRESGPSIWLRDLAGNRTVIGWFGYKPPSLSTQELSGRGRKLPGFIPEYAAQHLASR